MSTAYRLPLTDAFLTRVNIFNPAGPGVTGGTLLPFADITVNANRVEIQSGPVTIR